MSHLLNFVSVTISWQPYISSRLDWAWMDSQEGGGEGDPTLLFILTMLDYTEPEGGQGDRVTCLQYPPPAQSRPSQREGDRVGSPSKGTPLPSLPAQARSSQGVRSLG